MYAVLTEYFWTPGRVCILRPEGAEERPVSTLVMATKLPPLIRDPARGLWKPMEVFYKQKIIDTASRGLPWSLGFRNNVPVP